MLNGFAESFKAKHPDVPIIAFPRGAGQQAARFVFIATVAVLLAHARRENQL